MGKPMTTAQQNFFEEASSFVWGQTQDKLPPLRRKLVDLIYAQEESTLPPLLDAAEISEELQDKVMLMARKLAESVRAESKNSGGLDQFLKTYDLSSEEGVILMCLAEALLRIPDKATQDKLIKDKIGSADWRRHVGESDSTFVNAGTWALMLTGKVLKLQDQQNLLKRMVAESGEPVIRKAVIAAMRILGQQFVMGRTIKEAMKRSQSKESEDYTYSFDMLGESAKTAEDAEAYFKSYKEAIRIIARYATSNKIEENPGVSVKLSALHPRYEFSQKGIFWNALYDKMKYLCERAKEANINLCIDAEESECLDISLDLIKALYMDPDLQGWTGFGLALQAYQKRGYYVIDWLSDLVNQNEAQYGKRRPLMLRLVKGAYWDSEIKYAQELAMPDYPVFTRKENTDVSYLACARKIIKKGNRTFFPQFATHNAHTISYIYNVIKASSDVSSYEFQRLHGMGEDLYGALEIPCRVYAPVGSHEDLLAYLVRRLLENGANTSFVNQVVHEDVSVEDLIADPIAKALANDKKQHPQIPLPRDLFGESRSNSNGFDLVNTSDLAQLQERLKAFSEQSYHAHPLTPSYKNKKSLPKKPVTCPFQRDQVVGTVIHGDQLLVDNAVKTARSGYKNWAAKPAEERASILNKAADLLEENREFFYALSIIEAGKIIADAVAEVREAVDFLRYYALQASTKYGRPVDLPGPTGENNVLIYEPRGVFACISPWNFPLAIFVGQIAAAISVGNAVISKPADQTPVIGFEMIKLLHEAGVPKDVLHFIPGAGSSVGQAMIAHPDIAGVAFTGSTSTAQRINQTLAAKDGPIVPFIAETGGQNACLVDSTALPEQVVTDVVRSAFLSAGQRCSAMRVLYVQEDVADKLIAMLKGAMDELQVGNPGLLRTDVGPVIDNTAKKDLTAHIKSETVLHQAALKHGRSGGSFVPPTLIELKSILDLSQEHFGPILHVIRYKAKDLGKVIDEINATGYGLTFGIQTRIQSFADEVASKIQAGNIYVNRNTVGAIVGSQPFGGHGLSGTGPKAGGPNYLSRFTVEKVVSTDTTASGGNTNLMSLNT